MYTSHAVVGRVGQLGLGSAGAACMRATEGGDKTATTFQLVAVGRGSSLRKLTFFYLFF